MKSNNASHDDDRNNISDLGKDSLNRVCYNLEYNNENVNDVININNSSAVHSTCDISTTSTNIRVMFGGNVKNRRCRHSIGVEDCGFQHDGSCSGLNAAVEDHSFCDTGVLSPESSLIMHPNKVTTSNNNSPTSSCGQAIESDGGVLNVGSMIHLICSDEFLYNAEYLRKNAKISTQENIKLLGEDIVNRRRNNGGNSSNNHCNNHYNNRRMIRRLRLSRSLPWVVFQNDNYFSFGKSSIRKTRASVALSEEYYHIPVPNLFFREPIFQLLKSVRRVLRKPCEIEQLVNLNPMDPFLVESYLIKSRKIYSYNPKLVTDLLLTNIDNNYIEECLDTIVKVKLDRICNVDNFRSKLKSNLNYIHNATKSRYLINLLAKINFDPNKKSHNNLLSSLWNCYYSNDDNIKWELLGFQRCDKPYSDFRGVGILALVCLLYFSLAHPIESKIIHKESSNSKYWYSFAVTGINITSWLRDWLNQRDQRVIEFFYKTENDVNMLIIFCELFSYIFLKFHTFWMEKKPKNILEFPSIAQLFKSRINFPLSDKIFLERE